MAFSRQIELRLYNICVLATLARCNEKYVIRLSCVHITSPTLRKSKLTDDRLKKLPRE